MFTRIETDQAEEPLLKHIQVVSSVKITKWLFLIFQLCYHNPIDPA